MKRRPSPCRTQEAGQIYWKTLPSSSCLADGTGSLAVTEKVLKFPLPALVLSIGPFPITDCLCVLWAGKSTLLRHLATRRVGNFPPNVTVHYVSQEVNLDEGRAEMKPTDLVLEADIERRILLEEMEALQSGEGGQEGPGDAERDKRLQEVQETLSLIEADTAPDRARSLLQALGFSEDLLGRSMSRLSGGWRVRTALAAAIFARPDVLLLDEPTNHLSIQAILWLSRELSSNPVWQSRIIVIVSHGASQHRSIAATTAAS